MADKQDHGLHKLFISWCISSLRYYLCDIGTSPLYVLKSIMNMATAGHHNITDNLVLGGVSCVFWTLTIIVTIKYVILALSADNNGEGGIFALYAIVRRYKAKWNNTSINWMRITNGRYFITPPISISSAVEGLNILYPHIQTMLIVIVILVGNILAQQFGTNKIGNAFGPLCLFGFR